MKHLLTPLILSSVLLGCSRADRPAPTLQEADDARQKDLWAYDLETGEGRLLVSSTELLDGPDAKTSFISKI